MSAIFSMTALLLLLPASSLAFQGTSGDEGIEPQRIRQFHKERQAFFGAGESWQAFTASTGQGWQARFDEWSGQPVRAWGPGVPLPALTDAAAVEKATRLFLQSHRGLVGAEGDQLSLRSARYLPRTDTWYVSFQQLVHGIPVYRAGVEARIRHGRMVMFSDSTLPAGVGPVQPTLSSQTAIEEAIAQGRVPDVRHDDAEAELVYLPRARRDGHGLVLCWQVRTRTSSPPGRWVSHVDAASGELLNTYNEIRFVDGAVYGLHDDRNPGGGLVESALPYVAVEANGVRAFTDEEGNFSLEGDEFASVLSGSFVRVRNQDGDDGSLTFMGEEGLWDETSATQAEIDSFVFIQQVRDWAYAHAPEVSLTTDGIVSRVNWDSTCNAYFDGTVNFFQAGDGCNNTGQIADVNYHEWCHGLHYYSLEAGVFDGSVSEGIGDTCSFLLTGDPEIAPFFYTWGGSIRDVEEDQIYPDDYGDETHANGLILAGAIWDLWQILRADLEEESAFHLISQLFVDAIKSGFIMPDAYDEFIFADDDDGDLGNGTPHQCQILEAFVRHGLGPGGSSGVANLLHVPLENVAAGEPASIEAEVENLVPQCLDVEAAQGWVHFSLDGGETWDSSDLVLDGERLLGEIPAPPPHSVVNYYVEALVGDTSVVVPAGGSINPFTFYAGELWELYSEDFEADDGGFSHELLAGEAAEGADDWQHGAPNGAADDPSFAYSGELIWGNDLGYENWNGEYQNDKRNRLTSPSINTAPYADLVVQFRRWLNVEDGIYDQARVLVDGEEQWMNHATLPQVGDEHHRDGQWALATLALIDVGLDGQTQVAWDLQSDAGLAFGGWNIDDVCVYAPATPRNLMVITDFLASDNQETIELGWTNPDYDGLSAVEVAWRSDRYPSTVNDGDRVLRLDDAIAGQPVIANVRHQGGFFAVFAVDLDGTWTLGAYEAYNADSGQATRGGPFDVADNVLGGAGLEPGILGAHPSCGCASGSRSHRGWLLLLGLVAMALLPRRTGRDGRGRGAVVRPRVG